MYILNSKNIYYSKFKIFSKTINPAKANSKVSYHN